MAEQSQDAVAAKERLITTLAEQRAALGADVLRIQENLNVSKKVQLVVREHPRAWMGAAVGTGLFMGVVVPRVAAAVGSALTPKRRSSSSSGSGKGKKSSHQKHREDEQKEAATKGAALGSLIGGFGSLLLGALRPVLVKMIREQLETRVISRFSAGGGALSQRQRQAQPK